LKKRSTLGHGKDSPIFVFEKQVAVKIRDLALTLKSNLKKHAFDYSLHLIEKPIETEFGGEKNEKD